MIFFIGLNNELPENFQEKRKAGENDELICYLIRNDLLDDFIIYVNKNSFSIDSNHQFMKPILSYLIKMKHL